MSDRSWNRPRPMRPGRALLVSFTLHAGIVGAALGTAAYAAPLVAWTGVTVAPSAPLATEQRAAVAPAVAQGDLPIRVEPPPPEHTVLPSPPAPWPATLVEPEPRDESPPDPQVWVRTPPPRAWLETVQRATDDPPAAPPTAASAATTGGYVQPVALADQNEPPAYPHAAWRRGIEGTVVVLLQVDDKGAVTAAHVERSSGSSFLDDAALRQLARWRFAPARCGDRAVPGKFRQEVVFRLTR